MAEAAGRAAVGGSSGIGSAVAEPFAEQGKAPHLYDGADRAMDGLP